MQITQRVDDLVAEFQKFADWEDRYKYIIDLGKNLPEMREEDKTEQNKVKGCQSQVWLHAHLDKGIVYFSADSDASIVKGIVSILVRVYSGATPAEILATKPEFLDQIGLRQHLSMSRANGLSSMVKQISMFALAFKTKIDMGL